MTQRSAMPSFMIATAIVALLYATTLSAQQQSQFLEPLPTDPRQRIYYGDYYDPQGYVRCLEDWAKNNRDPRIRYCDIYKERLEPLDPSRRHDFGEFYDPQKYYECRQRVEQRDMRCEYLKLRRVARVEYWPFPEVPAPKLPDSPSDPVHKKGMNAKEYFQALCKAEAGEFIYKTIDNVEGVYQIRPRSGASQYMLRDRYVVEDPYGFTAAEADNAPSLFVGPQHYRFFEVPVEGERVRDAGLDRKHFHPSIFLRPPANAKVARYHGYDRSDPRSLKKEYDSKLKSRYGYTWREIRRLHDRENGISGGELIVVDLQTNEILAIRRGFLLAAPARYSRSGLTWEGGQFCPWLSKRAGVAKDYDASYTFVSTVLKPER